MKILKIERQKKDRNRYSLFSDDGFERGISEDTLVRFGIRAGDELGEDKMKELTEHDDFVSARKTAYDFLAYKARTGSEVLRKLRSKKYDSRAIERTIELLKEQKYLNDEEYAFNYAAEKIRSKPIGRELLKKKLIQKGIDKETVEQAIVKALEHEDESIIALEALRKYMTRSRAAEPEKARARCFRHLISRGFNIETATEATNIYLKEFDSQST